MSKGKLSTPAWVLEGFDSKEEYEKARQKAEPLASSSKSQTKGIKKTQKSKISGASTFTRLKLSKKEEKTFKVRVCPKCKSDNVRVVLTGEEGKGAKDWECLKCKWEGRNIDEKELSEDEFMKYLDDKGEEVA